jgi:hypothetical protein
MTWQSVIYEWLTPCYGGGWVDYQGGSFQRLLLKHFTMNDCMDAGGRATQDAKAENMKTMKIFSVLFFMCFMSFMVQ